MQNLLEVCCGLDVHKEVIVACLLRGSLDEEPEPVIREFPTLLSGLDEFKGWIMENGCRNVAMESTGGYTGFRFTTYWNPSCTGRNRSILLLQTRII